MPNTYANLGGTIGDILSRASGARTSGPQGYSAGVNAGSQHMLRSAQTGQSMADTDKIMYELEQARRGDATTGKDISAAMGVPDYMNQAMSLGEMATPSLNPAEESTPIPQAMQDKFTNANTMKIMQQLFGGTSAGGTVDTGMAALLKGQELGTRSNLQSGAQTTGDVAAAEAALLGKYPGRTGAGGGSASADIQMYRLLRSKEGGSKSVEEALKLTLGDKEAKALDDMMQSLVRSGMYETEDIEAMLPMLLESRRMNLDPAAKPAGIDPSLVVKRY